MIPVAVAGVAGLVGAYAVVTDFTKHAFFKRSPGWHASVGDQLARRGQTWIGSGSCSGPASARNARYPLGWSRLCD